MEERSRIARHVLEITVFVCGAIVMIYEINGSRILAPHIGTSTYVWTSLIGVILAALSFGYWYGGRVADHNPDARFLAGVVFAAGGAVSLTILVKDLVLAFIANMALMLELKAVLAALFLFAPASVLLGFVTPFSVKLRTLSLAETGATVGRLYALSTIGSIVGTFAAGFVLIPFVGSSRTLYLIAGGLFGVALLLAPFAVTQMRVVSVLLFVFGVLTGEAFSIYQNRRIELIDVDTEYSRIQIFRDNEETSGRPLRILAIDPGTIQSKMYLDGDDLATEYLRYYHLVRHFNPGFRRVLMIGGAGFSFPKDFLKRYPERSVEVVEIDPKMTRLARKYFDLKDDPRLSIHHEAGRVFLNRAPDSSYDAVLIDAFTALFSIPFHLTIQEAAQEMKRVLRAGGVAIFNVGGAIDGPKSRFFRAELATFGRVFPDVRVFKVRPEASDEAVQNLLIVARANRMDGMDLLPDAEIERLLRQFRNIPPDSSPVLTDDLAPVELFNSGR